MNNIPQSPVNRTISPSRPWLVVGAFVAIGIAAAALVPGSPFRASQTAQTVPGTLSANNTQPSAPATNPAVDAEASAAAAATMPSANSTLIGSWTVQSGTIAGYDFSTGTQSPRVIVEEKHVRVLACNLNVGSATITSQGQNVSSVLVSRMTSTRKMCEPEAMLSEAAIVKFFAQQELKATVVGQTLTLTHPSGSSLVLTAAK